MDSRSRSPVGREAELGEIDRFLDGTRLGAGRILTVEGEPGIGKTRLLAALRRRSEDRGHPVLHGVASELEACLPFGVVTDAFDAYLASLAASRPTSGPPPFAPSSAGHLPSLRAEGDREGRRVTSATAPIERSVS